MVETRAFDYRGEFGNVYHGGRKLPVGAQQWISRVRAKKLQGFISPSDRVLEYGVGFGWNLASLQCREKVGFDLASELRSEVERKGIRFETEEDRLPPSSYDRILAHHVLEHVPSPVLCLKRFKSHLVPGGKLLLFVPFEREAKYLKFKKEDRAHHLYSWTPGALARVVAGTGWTIEQLRLCRFRFDRIAALLAGTVRGGFGLYQLLRKAGLLLLPEFEIFLIARK